MHPLICSAFIESQTLVFQFSSAAVKEGISWDLLVPARAGTHTHTQEEAPFGVYVNV